MGNTQSSRSNRIDWLEKGRLPDEVAGNLAKVDQDQIGFIQQCHHGYPLHPREIPMAAKPVSPAQRITSLGLALILGRVVRPGSRACLDPKRLRRFASPRSAGILGDPA